MIKTELGTPDDLAYLRAESLRPVLFGVMVALYLWYLILFHPINPLGAEGWGPVLLGLGLAVAFVARKRNVSLASVALIAGIALTNLYNMWRLDASTAPYLLAIVVTLTGLLFNLKAVVWATILCSSAIMGVGFAHWGHSLFSEELLSPVLVIILVGVSSSLTVRNLYLTLYWAWDRAMAAQHNEEKLLDRQGELARALKALDVAYTQLERLNYDLARAREAAEEARLAKQQFATNISHELRTPLNVIMAFSEMMYLSPSSYEAPLPPPYRGDIREIYRSSKHLLQLTDDVLSLSRIEAREMKIHVAPTQLQDMVAEAISIVRPLLRGKAVELRAELPKNLPPLTIDRARIGQVLLNLLNNARRFTERGQIMVRAALETGQVQITVADTGIGISPHELHQVFKEFRQLDGSVSIHQEGSGLGLAISKRFVELHGGHIWVESEGIPGQGSRFHFTLPLKNPQFVAEPSHKTPLPVRTPRGRGRTILLLDPDPYIAQLVEEALEEYQVAPVKDIAEISNLVIETRARAVVLNLAQKDRAWQQLLELREKLQSFSLPVILCPLIGPIQLSQALRVKDYLIKPITREALLGLLDQVGTDIRRILVIDDDPRMGHLLTRLLQTDPREYEIIRANNGREGLKKMQEELPDLVLMDLSMPEMDGYTLLAHMQKEPKLCHIPVAVITAHTSEPQEERRLGGQTLFISNPSGFSNEEALTYLRHILNAAGVPASLQRPGHAIQGGQQIGLGDGFPQVAGGPQ